MGDGQTGKTGNSMLNKDFHMGHGLSLQHNFKFGGEGWHRMKVSQGEK